MPGNRTRWRMRESQTPSGEWETNLLHLWNGEAWKCKVMQLMRILEELPLSILTSVMNMVGYKKNCACPVTDIPVPFSAKLVSRTHTIVIETYIPIYSVFYYVSHICADFPWNTLVWWFKAPSAYTFKFIHETIYSFQHPKFQTRSWNGGDEWLGAKQAECSFLSIPQVWRTTRHRTCHIGWCFGK